MDVPGHVGWTVTGDKTVEFARFPLDFVKNRIEKYNSRVFVSRALNKPTIFVTSNNGIKEILIDKSSSFGMGYKDFGYMHALYGDLFLFDDDEEAYRVRDLVRGLFHKDNCDHYMKTVTRITHEKLESIDVKTSVDAYTVFKDLATEICLALFLDVDESTEFHTVKAAATLHWHGLISVPLSLKVKGWSSSYGKASEAKEYLIQLIIKKLESNNNKGRFLQCVSEANFESSHDAATHVLLFISAIIPKAFSSLLTSFVLETAGDFKEELRERSLSSDKFLDDVLLEVQRLWPPLYGGKRVSKEEVIIDGFKIPKNYSIAYIIRFGNRDHDIFHQADQFIPERWQEEEKKKKNLVWTFGAGTRSCVGVHFIDSILKHVSSYLLKNFDWSIVGGDEHVYKTLPVARPKEALQVSFTSKER